MTEFATKYLPSVLLTFRASNVFSFRDEFELSLLASGSSPNGWDVPWRIDGKPLRVLPSAAIFGANASGKSNVLKAMAVMRALVDRSFRDSTPEGELFRAPFMLDSASRNEATTFEIEFVLSGIRHEYGFTYTQEEVLEEWAYQSPHGKAAKIFHRTEMELSVGSKFSGQINPIKQLLRPNALVLSTAAAASSPALLPLFGWFSRNLLFADSSNRSRRQYFTADLLEDDDTRPAALALLRAADLGISDVSRKPADPIREKVERAFKEIMEEERSAAGDTTEIETDNPELAFLHTDGSRQWELDASDESLGTMVWLGVVGPVIHALANGSVLLVDELDASLHPLLVARVIQLFSNEESNPRRAQLIFNTHDISVIGETGYDGLIGRDQIWFAEKRPDGASTIYPLTDFGPRVGEAVAKRYMSGRYGATPIIDDSEFEDAARRIGSPKATPSD